MTAGIGAVGMPARLADCVPCNSVSRSPPAFAARVWFAPAKAGRKSARVSVAALAVACLIGVNRDRSKEGATAAPASGTVDSVARDERGRGELMKDIAQQVDRSYKLSSRVTEVFQKRVAGAQQRFDDRIQSAYHKHLDDLLTTPKSPWEIWGQAQEYSVDLAQRSILFWDTLRQRGNNYLAHERAGSPPVLHFEYETVLDARQFDRPVNYALLRIIPPAGVTVDPKRRPYVIIDPRAGHGPGIGGFKDDSQVGVALREGHPVYFVAFFPEPEPGQTLLDVCDTEARFVRHVRELHPESPKPVIVGNCQGGWAAMMLAATSSDETGPIVINGAPMSYWGGAWSEGAGDNPMRYAGGMLGGSWLASLTSDLGNGVFDGAHLVQNFENLNPANTFWDKYYNLFANIDTEPPRFLEFERWWGGFFLLNREEIEWIVENLFVGNQLWSGETRGQAGKALDLREIKAPIILFASMGDNITPPQQAFNWVADVYGSTDAIKAGGQTIVGLLHQDVGHLGIFVSGKVAKKEHTQIVSVLKSIEALPPGLYGMRINETRGADGKTVYDVEFVERELEEISESLNRFERVDEKPFLAAKAVSDFNEQAYELFMRPLVQAFSSDDMAELGREFHPLRFQRWALSDQNPWLWWLGPAAGMVKAQRVAAEKDQPFRQVEQMMSELMSGSLDYFREVRDAMSEALFFETYGNLFLTHMAEGAEALAPRLPGATDSRDLPFVRAALDAMAEGGYQEALARVAALLAPHGLPIPLSRLEVREGLLTDYRELLPDLSRHEMRRLRGEQDIIVRYEPERALETLPLLVPDPGDRERLLTLLDRLLADPRMAGVEGTAEQRQALDRIRTLLGNKAASRKRRPAGTKS
jgi:pimeloyl-ACP methyl ester carboxylesterase